MKLIENKPSNDKSSYFLTDNFYKADSQPNIPTTMATPLIEKSASSEILSPTVEDEIDSFVTSDVENNDNDSSETLDLIDSAYKNIKYKKIKDILLRDIKNDLSEFIESEIKQKLGLHNKEEYQTLVDKRIIATLEKETEFLKTEICSKNEIINKFLSNNTQKNNNDNMKGEIWDFGNTCNTSDSQSVCSTVKSRDSLAIFSEINIISHKPSKRNIDDQLKTIRKENHKEYLHNVDCKSPLMENNKNNKNPKQCDNLQDRNVDKKQPKETNNNSLWPSGTCAIVGDSVVNGIDEKRLSKKHGNVEVFHFSRARIEDINQYIIPIIKKEPDYLILHVRTNDATTNTSKKIVEDLLILKSSISKQLPSCRIVLSIIRHDDGKANLTIRNVNKHLSALQSECIDNDNISSQHLGRKGLHLNPKGKGRLALNFMKQIRKF